MNIESEDIKRWVKTQMECSRIVIKRSFDHIPSLDDASDTPEYHLGYYQAMRNLLDKIKELEGEA